ncbi:MAG: cytochrome c [Rhodocyclales bacterium]|nr:cytochrome c [Rhodocyclales bacterium]
MSRLPALLLISLLTLAACGEVEDTRPGQPVKTRQQAFKALLRSFEPMGTMLKDKRYDADKFAAMAAELVAAREAPWGHFGPDTNYPPSKSKADVWNDPAAFEQAKKDFINASDALLVAAQSKQEAAVGTPYQKVYDTCQNCHKTFRQR